MRRAATLLLLGACSFAALLAVGGGTQPTMLGDPPPAGIERASLQTILQDKARFAGKTVLIEGRAGGIGCADCGGILVTDETWRMLVEPEDPSRFRIEPRQGVRVRAWGIVDVEGAEGEGEGKAEAAEHEEGEENDPAHAKLHQDLGHVELEARGVEWL